ncbi:hypothetical protein ASZ90_016472 [hydrocarbon metagenome]|uniref:Uncharacterized protein n=1 Tax=hydrocarbon metagenome TaxID=938273 RepID=A0A0W8ESL2_9ZZZZ
MYSAIFAQRGSWTTGITRISSSAISARNRVVFFMQPLLVKDQRERA